MAGDDREKMVHRIHELADDVKSLPWFSINKLRQGDILEIKTTQKLIKIKILNPALGMALLDIFNKEAPITGEYGGQEGTHCILVGTDVEYRKGSSLVINKGQLAVGFPIILDTGADNLLRLTPTREVWLNGVRALPDYSYPKTDKPR